MFKSAVCFESDLLKVQSINRKMGGGMTHKPAFQWRTKDFQVSQHAVDGHEVLSDSVITPMYMFHIV